jgi:IS1 family transposase
MQDFGHIIGDTVQFTSLNPYRIIVSGRIKHYICFWGTRYRQRGRVLCKLCKGMRVNEFTVAQITPDGYLPYHEWFIEFEQEPENWSTLQKQ